LRRLGVWGKRPAKESVTNQSQTNTLFALCWIDEKEKKKSYSFFVFGRKNTGQKKRLSRNYGGDFACKILPP
jgi:hypothetical protein